MSKDIKKYYATRRITIDGKTYNKGEIVNTHLTGIEGLELSRKQDKPKNKKKRSPIKKLTDKFKSTFNISKLERPEISVIITFHNQEEYVRECLNGFYSQTINKPIEIIAINDASKDKTGEIIKKEYPEVDYFEVDFKNANKGRNLGLKQARGKYISFFDGDDYPYPEYLEKLHKALQENPDKNLSYARYNHDNINLENGLLPIRNAYEWSESWLKYSSIINTPSLIKRYLAERVNWDEKLECYQDQDYNLALLEAGAKGVQVREELWHYRTHKKSTWNSGKGWKNKEEAKEIIKTKYNVPRKQAKITFTSLISRDDCLEEYFNQIPKLGIPKKETHWLIIIDTDEDDLINKALDFIKKYEDNFLSSRVFITNEKNKSVNKNHSFCERADRISNFVNAIINEAANTGTEYLFMVEDDTICPKNSFKKLFKHIKKDDNMAYISGIECGRGYSRHTGVTQKLEKDSKGEIIRRIIPETKNGGLDEIQGGGWYCWIGRVKAFTEEMRKGFKLRCLGGRKLGPDVLMVHDLNQLGWGTYVNWEVQCKHYHPDTEKFLEAKTGKGYLVDYFKKNNKWEMEINKL